MQKSNSFSDKTEVKNKEENFICVDDDDDYITLYHGTHINFKDINLAIGAYSRDFGNGFYLTKSLEQAKDWGKQGVLWFKEVGCKHIKYFVKVYRLDRKALNKLSYKCYKNYDKFWLDEIVLCRGHKDDFFLIPNRDATEGPMADGELYSILYKYKKHIWNVDKTLEEIKRFRKSPELEICNHQICIHTLDAKRCLIEVKDALIFEEDIPGI